MKGKKILIAITGSIAAYKIPSLVRLLIKAGAEVQIIMTPAAKEFVSELVLGTLSKRPVLIEMFDESTWSNHVMLGRWADHMLIAPASCNTIAKMANGFCDNLVLATYLSAVCLVTLAAAMDEDMWHHPTTKNNLQILRTNGVQIVDAEHGELASGLVGMGRMAEPEDLLSHLELSFKKSMILKGKTVVITAGPTYENLDPVRFIGNYSTGKMGICIAEYAASLGATVHLVLGPTYLSTTANGIKTYNVKNAETMYKKTVSLFPKCDIGILSAAVADYTPKVVAADKIKKADGALTLELTKTKDILKQLGSIKTKQQYLIGFALESTDGKAYALKKLKEKNCNMIILNSLQDAGAGFAHATNKVTIFDNKGAEKSFNLKNKELVAIDILEHLIAYAKWK
jgi:phosphopantothenoylcysteine decarboxylase / phosphopantothenate---cysteine ligase